MSALRLKVRNDDDQHCARRGNAARCRDAPRFLRLAVLREIERFFRIRRVSLSAFVTCKPIGDKDVFQSLKLICAALRSFQQGCLMLFLAREDLRRLTGKVRFGAQRLALDRLGIRYTIAATGEPLVRMSSLDGAQGSARNREPRWDLFNV